MFNSPDVKGFIHSENFGTTLAFGFRGKEIFGRGKRA
jgi:hypothetical protein